ncbi:MAG: sodium:alanine symporter family protein [Clostridia bacterium]|nr:sodium:alanine symporter family protein [Clostridia bacterium]
MDALSSIMALFTLGTGVFLTLRLRFFQFTHLSKAIRAPFERRSRKTLGGVTPFQAMATALGGSIGTANIAGVSGAIITGGPGAVFWMWLAGLFGMATKLCEIVLAVKYRDQSTSRSAGGPTHYILRGIGRRARPLAVLYAVFCCAAGLIGTAPVQSNTIALAAAGDSVTLRAVCGVLTAILTGCVIFGGAKRIGAFSERAVPFMAALYVCASAAAIIMHSERIAPALEAIVTGAFAPRPAAGGLAYAGFMRAFRVGTARGVYSNEAGVGSGAMAHAGSIETDPVKQGLFGVFEVFADTIVMCSLTALVILTSGVGSSLFSSESDGMRLARMAFEASFGSAAKPFLSVSVLLFAFTSLVGWSLYGESSAVFLFGVRAVLPYRLIFLLLIPAGAVIDAGSAWRAGELLNYLMALPNLFALIMLSGRIKKEVSHYKMFEKSRGKHYNKG